MSRQGGFTLNREILTSAIDWYPLKLNEHGNPICPCGDRLPYGQKWDGEMYCTTCGRVLRIQPPSEARLILIRREIVPKRRRK